MRLSARAVSCAVLLVGILFPTGAHATTPVPFPTSPKGWPVPTGMTWTVDAPSGYVGQIACDPAPKPGTLKLRDALKARYGNYPIGLNRTCNEGTSEHADGRALDWMVDSRVHMQRHVAADFLAWATANNGRYAKRMGIMYLIYNNHMWSAYRADEGWRSGSYGHVDHVHISLSWNGARGNVSWWTLKTQPTDFGPCRVFTGQPAVPRATPRTTKCPATAALVKTHKQSLRMLGMGGSGVTVIQSKLGVQETGVVDTDTRNALFSWQATHDLPRTGALDHPTWSSLAPLSVVKDTYKAFTPATAADTGLKEYGGRTLRAGQVGRGPALLQIALGLPETVQSGYFGAVTREAVREIQRTLGRSETGVAGLAEWQYLAARS